MKIPDDEPTVVFVIGFSSLQDIESSIPGLLNGLTRIDLSSTMGDLKSSSRFLLWPTKDELLGIDQNTPCLHLVAYARTMKKQVFVVMDSIRCIYPALRGVASHMICSPSSCHDIFNSICGVWMDTDNNTLELFN